MKVHFAGGDGANVDKILFNYGIRYRLSSFFYIRKQKEFNPTHLNNFNHSIVDSGLFTLMFGNGKEKSDEQALIKWQENYIKWINSHSWNNVSFVECDVQKKLSAETAWEFRKEMKARVRQPIIHAYHIEDGNPDRLIDFSDYIAISMPELRFSVTDKERFQITKYIAVKACLKGKRVHILGCTEEDYLRYFSFCYSCDSTSWRSPMIYGDVHSDLIGETHINSFKEVTNNDGNRVQALCAYLHLHEYSKQAGNQL